MFETSVLVIAAGLLIAVGMTRFAAAGIASTLAFNRDRRHRASDLRSLRQTAEIARLNSELQSSAAGGSGLDWRVMEVAEVVQESEDCCSYYLVDPYGQALPSFHPGQYLMVRPALAGAYQTTRCYSLSSSPNPRYWRITVKRQESADGEQRRPQNGGLSKWIHRTIGEGDCLLIGGPNGQFFLPADSKRALVLLAAGVGITPMASMLRWSLENTPERPVRLLYQAKDREHWPLGESLHAWQTSFSKCHVRSFFSRVEEPDIETLRQQLPGQVHAGRFDASTILEAAGESQCDYRGCDYYFCGPDTWMQSLRDGLREAGVPAERVHWESFGGTSATATNSDSSTTANGQKVRFEHSQVDAQWADSQQTLWELARESQVEIPSGCLSGVCGCCRVRLLSGEVEYDRSVSIELPEGECLSCVARPKTDLVIDA